MEIHENFCQNIPGKAVLFMSVFFFKHISGSFHTFLSRNISTEIFNFENLPEISIISSTNLQSLDFSVKIILKWLNNRGH